MQIVTAGSAYLDIDAYAGMVAYAELLNKQGILAKAATTAPLNESVTQTVLSWNAPLDTAYRPADDDTFTIIDLSIPEVFDSFVALDRVTEVIDHHLGYEAYWQERIGDKAHIEFIGAACTLVYERWQAAGLVDQMSTTSARLLICGILDNTLNFGAKITTERDRAAYADLMRRADLPMDWPAQYFGECEAFIVQDVAQVAQASAKPVRYPGRGDTVVAGQLAVWDAQGMLAGHQEVLVEAMERMAADSPWFMNLISVGTGNSCIVCANPALQDWLGALLSVRFEGVVAQADRLWLRKEITQQAMHQSA